MGNYRPSMVLAFVHATASLAVWNCTLDSGETEQPRQYSALRECDTSNPLGLDFDSSATDSMISRPAPAFENSRLSNVCRDDSSVVLYATPPVPSVTEVTLNGIFLGSFEGGFGRKKLDSLRPENTLKVVIKYLGDDPLKKGKTNQTSFYFLHP